MATLRRMLSWRVTKVLIANALHELVRCQTLKQLAELLRAIMVKNGDAAKAAMITEGGWNDHPRWTRAVRPAQRIAYTLRAYEIALQEWPWLDALCLWVFRFPWDQNSYQDYFTFVRTDFEPKPIYTEVQRSLHELAP